MTATTLTSFDLPLNRFDQPLLGVMSDLLHLVYFWPATSDSFGFIEDVEYEPPTDEFKRAMLGKQDGMCPWCEDLLDFDDIEVDHVWPRSKGGRHWIFNLQVLHSRCNREKSDRIDFALGNISPLLPHLVALIRWLSKRPRLAALIIGGIALIVAIAIAVKWLRKYVDGLRRYARLALESLSHAAGTLSGHLSDASQQALRVQSNACGFAEKTRGIAGQLGRETTHRLVTKAGEMPGRFGPAATRIRDASPKSLAEPVGLALRSARRAGGTLSESARTAAAHVKSRACHAPGLVRGATERASDMLPTPRRKTRPAFALNT